MREQRKKVYLRIKPVRYECGDCPDHPSTTEQYTWCDRNAKVTKAMEEYLMRSLINSTVEDVSRKVLITALMEPPPHSLNGAIY